MFSLLLRDAHLQHGAWRAAWSYAWPSREGEHGKPSFQPTCVNFGRLQNFFLIFTSLSLLFSCNCAGFVWFSVHTLFYISFFFLCGSFHFFFFFNLIFWFSFLPILLRQTHCMCLSFFFLSFFFSFSLFFSFLPTFSFSQHWNTGGSHPEELERPGAHAGLEARPQPPLFPSLASAEPQFTDCVALPEHSIPAD